MRILKFVGTFVGTLLLVFFIVFGFNLNALYTLFENSADLQEGQEWVPKTKSLKGLTEYIGAHPDRVSVASRSAINPDTAISYSPDTPHTMGTLSNFFLIATYARKVETGEINPDKLVSLKEIDHYQLPYIDASNHDDAKSWLDNHDAITPEGKARLQDLVQVSLILNDLAISDYLYFTLGSEAIDSTQKEMQAVHSDAPLPFAGLYITVNTAANDTDTSFEKHFSRLKNLSKQDFRDSVAINENRYLHDESFHQKTNTLFEQEEGLGMGFSERRDVLSLFPKSTADELSRLMVELQHDSLISAPVSKRIKDLMDWPFDQQSLNSDFEYYGAIYDSRLGLLNGIDYGASTYSGEPFGQATFFDSLQVAFWFHMSSSLMHQDYQQRLMWDPALRTATLQEIGK